MNTPELTSQGLAKETLPARSKRFQELLDAASKETNVGIAIVLEGLPFKLEPVAKLVDLTPKDGQTEELPNMPSTKGN